MVVRLPASWLLLRTPPATGAWNMACDAALMNAARTQDSGMLRIYEWAEPTVSFGRHERTRGVYSPEALTKLGVAAVRRPTGGRALLHSREVTYSVTMPIADDSRWSVVYDLINERLLRAIRSLGIPARIVGRDNFPPTVLDAPVQMSHAESQVCFSGAVSGEIAVGERKLVASSVWRERGAYLQHGSILIHDDQHRLSALLGPTAPPPKPAAALCEWLSPALSVAAVVESVECALHESFRDCGNFVRWSIPPEVIHDVNRQQKLLSESSWLWRR